MALQREINELIQQAKDSFQCPIMMCIQENKVRVSKVLCAISGKFTHKCSGKNNRRCDGIPFKE